MNDLDFLIIAEWWTAELFF